MSKGGSKVGFWIAIGVLLMMLFGSFLVNIGLLGTMLAGTSSGESDYPVDEVPNLTEVWSYGYGEAKVVRIALSGEIMRGGEQGLFSSGPDMVESILAQIRSATLDEEVKAILLEINSPGGAVTPSDEIYAALEHFKRTDEERIIVVFIRDLCASGGYYAAMAGDYLMAEPTSIIGSVGVIMQTMNMKGLGEKLGLSSVTIASGDNKDMLNPLKEVDPKQLGMLQEMVDDMQDRFATIVQSSRGFEDRSLLDGRVFPAPKALLNGFIDEIGYFQGAIDKTIELLGVKEVYMVRYTEKTSFFESLIGAEMPKVPMADLSRMNRTQMLYMWQP